MLPGNYESGVQTEYQELGALPMWLKATHLSAGGGGVVGAVGGSSCDRSQWPRDVAKHL
jgi:hypothetical protein